MAFNEPDMRENRLYVSMRKAEGGQQATLLYLDHHLEDAPENTPALSLLAAADTLEGLAKHVGMNYHGITAHRTGRFIGNALPEKQLEGIALERPLSQEEFRTFWQQVQKTYSYRDGFA